MQSQLSSSHVIDMPKGNEPDQSEKVSPVPLQMLGNGDTSYNQPMQQSTVQKVDTYRNLDELHSSFPALISVGSKKNPITPEWQLVTTDKSDAKKQGQRYIGILCGSVNQVDVIDCDIVKQEDVDRYNQNKTDCEQFKQEGYYSDAKGEPVFIAPKELVMPKCGVKWMNDNFPELENQTLMVRSQSGGMHLYVQSSGLKTKACIVKGDKALKIDTRGEGGQIISPFSRDTRSGNVKPQVAIPREQQVSKCVECNGKCGTAPGAYILANMIKPAIVPAQLRSLLETTEVSESSSAQSSTLPHRPPSITEIAQYIEVITQCCPTFAQTKFKFMKCDSAGNPSFYTADHSCYFHSSHSNQHCRVSVYKSRIDIFCLKDRSLKIIQRDEKEVVSQQCSSSIRTLKDVEQAQSEQPNKKQKKLTEKQLEDIAMYRVTSLTSGDDIIKEVEVAFSLHSNACLQLGDENDDFVFVNYEKGEEKADHFFMVYRHKIIQRSYPTVKDERGTIMTEVMNQTPLKFFLQILTHAHLSGTRSHGFPWRNARSFLHCWMS